MQNILLSHRHLSNFDEFVHAFVLAKLTQCRQSGANLMLPASSKGLVRRAKPDSPRSRSKSSPIRRFRVEINLPRSAFARCMACSERALANWEAGRSLPNIYQSRLNELQTLHRKLTEIIDSKEVGRWISTPHPHLDGFKPLEIIERGENFRLWQLIIARKALSYDDCEN